LPRRKVLSIIENLKGSVSDTSELISESISVEVVVLSFVMIPPLVVVPPFAVVSTRFVAVAAASYKASYKANNGFANNTQIASTRTTVSRRRSRRVGRRSLVIVVEVGFR
jgi:hypothetical protein